MPTQYYVPGPAQVWVGTKGEMCTRVVFPGGGTLATGANAIVTSVGPKGQIQAISITDDGDNFDRNPGAIFVGGGFGAINRGTVSAKKVTGIESVPRWPPLLTVNTPEDAGKGLGYVQNQAGDKAFGWEFLGWSEAGVAMDSSFVREQASENATGQIPSDSAITAMAGRITMTLARYDSDVLTRAIARCLGGNAIASFAGLTDVAMAVETPNPDVFRPTPGSLMFAQFLYFPIIVLAPYAYRAPKSAFYDGMARGIHVPAATIDSWSTPFSVRARRIPLAISCHWVHNSFTLAGMLFDHAVECISNPIPT